VREFVLPRPCGSRPARPGRWGWSSPDFVLARARLAEVASVYEFVSASSHGELVACRATVNCCGVGSVDGSEGSAGAVFGRGVKMIGASARASRVGRCGLHVWNSAARPRAGRSPRACCESPHQRDDPFSPPPPEILVGSCLPLGGWERHPTEPG
jgi:hypothetical protein